MFHVLTAASALAASQRLFAVHLNLKSSTTAIIHKFPLTVQALNHLSVTVAMRREEFQALTCIRPELEYGSFSSLPELCRRIDRICCSVTEDDDTESLSRLVKVHLAEAVRWLAAHGYLP